MPDASTPTEFRPYPEWQMHLYSRFDGVPNACTYYRVHVPMMGLQELGLAESFLDKGIHHYDKEIALRQSLFAMLTADVVLFHAIGGENGAVKLGLLSQMKPGTIEGKVIYPPSSVYDIDDNLDYVHPYNATYSVYGIRDTKGDLLSPGDMVSSKLGDGRELVLWQDQVTQGEKGVVFDIERNQRQNRELHAFASACDGFTTPSPYLAKYHTEVNKYKNAYVFPNSIIPKDWVTPKFAPRKKEIRVLWQGGASHASDWYALRSAMVYIAKKYPHVKFVFFGVAYEWIINALPAAQVEVHDWVMFDGYRPTRAILDCDINLCVLRDDVFSRSKSAIKFYEGSISPHAPEATLAPKMAPYSDEIIDGETGLLYDVSGTQSAAAESFAANLEELIRNVELRRRVSLAAHKWVMENRHYLKTVPGYYEYLLELRRRKVKDCPYDPEADKLPPPEPSPVVKAPKKKKTPRKKK